MKNNRIERMNSLLQEIIYQVIHEEVKNPHITTFVTVTRVETSADFSHAKVFISMIADAAEKEKVLHALQSAAGFIAIHAHKKLDRLRYFPQLLFKIDTGLDDQLRIHEILTKLEDERKKL